MSSKIDVWDIICGHAKTMSNSNGRILVTDLITFFGIPAVFALASGYLLVNLGSEVVSMLVNFGAIFTALLLSVLVLVYDQESKLDSLPASPIKEIKKRVLRELYYNISYSIICSVALIFVCFMHSAIDKKFFEVLINDEGKKIFYGAIITTPLAVFITTNLFLTIVMVVKRMHSLLTSGQ